MALLFVSLCVPTTGVLCCNVCVSAWSMQVGGKTNGFKDNYIYIYIYSVHFYTNVIKSLVMLIY